MFRGTGADDGEAADARELGTSGTTDVSETSTLRLVPLVGINNIVKEK